MQIRGYPRGQCIFAASIFGAAGAFFLFLYATQRAASESWIALVIAAVCFWLCAYWYLRPEILAVLRPDGMDFLNENRALFFQYRWTHIRWDQITSIDTWVAYPKGRPINVTSVGAEDPSRRGAKVSFRINSGHRDYYRFLQYLKDSIGPNFALPGTTTDRSLPQRRRRVHRNRLLAVLLISIFLLALAVYILRR
jgi:hypothetical protein